MVKLTSSPVTGGPSSSIGIIRFFDSSSGGPKLSPEFVLGLSIAFIVFILAIKLIAGL